MVSIIKIFTKHLTIDFWGKLLISTRNRNNILLLSKHHCYKSWGMRLYEDIREDKNEHSLVVEHVWHQYNIYDMYGISMTSILYEYIYFWFMMTSTLTSTSPLLLNKKQFFSFQSIFPIFDSFSLTMSTSSIGILYIKTLSQVHITMERLVFVIN